MKRIRIPALLLAIAAAGSITVSASDAYKSECIKPNLNCIWQEYFCGNQQRPELPNIPEIPEKPIVPETPEVNVDAHEYELKVLELVNAERAKYGLLPLSWDSKLAEVARAHSQDMAKRGFFSHNNPDGKTPFDRIKAAGINYRSAGENIAAGQKTPEEVVKAWMNSSGHRANILNANYTKLGVGYLSGSGTYKTYWTQNFIG